MERDDNTLEAIAQTYHLHEADDMFIENSAQRREWGWLSSKIKEGARVLDLGFGDGVVFALLDKLGQERNLDLTLIEGAASLVAKASELYPKRKVVHGYFEDLDRGLFDVIIASHVLEHVEDPRHVLRVLRSSLKPGGQIIGIVPNAGSIHRRIAVQMGIQSELDSKSDRDRMVGHLRVYSVQSLNDDVAHAGLEITDVCGFFLKPFPNSMLKNLNLDEVMFLIQLGEKFPPEFSANLGFVISNPKT